MTLMLDNCANMAFLLLHTSVNDRSFYLQLNRVLCGLPETEPDIPLTAKSEHFRLPPIRDSQQQATPTRPLDKWPVKTSQAIGWKSTRKEYQLERYGKCAPKARGYVSLMTRFNWPWQGAP